MAKKKPPIRRAKKRPGTLVNAGPQTRTSEPVAVGPAAAEAPSVKITVEQFERGTALFAVRGSRIDVGPRTILRFEGTTLYWTKKQWSENRSEAAVLVTKADLLVELERAKLAAPFQAKASELLVEWKRFLS